MQFGSYYAKLSEKGLVLKDIFGIKEVSWSSIVSMSTNESLGLWNIITNKGVFVIRNNESKYTDVEFEKYIAEHSGISVSAEIKPLKIKRWAKAGVQYTHADYIDKLMDGFFGIKSKEGLKFGYIALGIFLLGLIAVIYGYFSIR